MAQQDNWQLAENTAPPALRIDGLKPKDLVGIPWMVAFALRNDGWYLRSEIIWAKRNCMPESVTDRPTKSHEQIFLLSKSQSYFYDNKAVKEPLETKPHNPGNKLHKDKISGPNDRNGHSQWETSMDKVWGASGLRNLRDVWAIASEPYPDSHFATFPTEIPRKAIMAGTSAKGCCPGCGAPWERVVLTNNPSKTKNTGHDMSGGAAVTGNPQTSAGLHRNGGGVFSKFKNTLL